MSGIAGISAHELEGIRQDVQVYLPENVVLHRNTATRTASGGTTMTLARHSTGPGRLGPMSTEAEARWLDRLGTSRGWVVTLEEDRDVRINDVLYIGTRRFEVLGWDQDRSYPLTQRVGTRELSA